MKHAPINPPPVVLCPRCETEFVGSATPPDWRTVTVNGTGHLLCPDCADHVADDSDWIVGL